MRISVVHSTFYRYDAPVYQEPHTIRLRPREDPAQHLLQYALEISPPPAGRADCLDQDGNVVVEAWFKTPVEELAVKSSFEVETLRDNPFAYSLASPAFAALPLVYPEPLHAAMAPYLGSASEGPVRDFAHALATETGWKTLPFLTALNRRLFDTVHQVFRDHGAPHPAELTLAQRSGSCRDVAVLFCAACRAVGIPARFVSGYEREAAFPPAHLHAWGEVYLAGGGWRGYDPSRGLAVHTAYVAVAAAADPRLAAPVSGSFRGAARGRMDFTIEMQVRNPDGSSATG